MAAKGFSLLEDFLPDYQFRSRHQALVQAPAAEVYRCLKTVNLADSFWIRSLFRLRGIRLFEITLDSLQKIRFNWLAEKPGEELILGVVGKFWTVRGHLRKLTPEQFREFSQAEFAKAVWHIGVESLAEGQSLLSTETRIYCPDPKTYRKFRFYWVFISPFSGWIRSITLRLIKRRAEAA